MLFAAAWIIGINLLSFLLFWHDKRQARSGGWRISENHLLLFAMLGGWPGSLLARHVFRHKTRKQPFVTLLLLIVGLEAGALIGWIALGQPVPEQMELLSRQM